MKQTINLLTIYAMIILCACAVFAQKTELSDEAMIRQNVEQMAKGWNAGNGAEFAKPFAENADYVIINGMHISGRTAIAEGHQAIFNAIYKGSRNTPNIEKIRFVRSDVAVVHVEWNLTFFAGGKELKGHARSTLLMTRENGKWEIISFQNTPIQPPAAMQGGK